MTPKVLLKVVAPVTSKVLLKSTPPVTSKAPPKAVSPETFRSSKVTVPENIGLAELALEAMELAISLNSVENSEPLIVLAGSPEGKESLAAKFVVGV